MPGRRGAVGAAAESSGPFSVAGNAVLGGGAMGAMYGGLNSNGAGGGNGNGGANGGGNCDAMSGVQGADSGAGKPCAGSCCGGATVELAGRSVIEADLALPARSGPPCSAVADSAMADPANNAPRVRAVSPPELSDANEEAIIARSTLRFTVHGLGLRTPAP